MEALGAGKELMLPYRAPCKIRYKHEYSYQDKREYCARRLDGAFVASLIQIRYEATSWAQSRPRKLVCVNTMLQEFNLAKMALCGLKSTDLRINYLSYLPSQSIIFFLRN